MRAWNINDWDDWSLGSARIDRQRTLSKRASNARATPCKGAWTLDELHIITSHHQQINSAPFRIFSPHHQYCPSISTSNHHYLSLFIIKAPHRHQLHITNLCCRVTLWHFAQCSSLGSRWLTTVERPEPAKKYSKFKNVKPHQATYALPKVHQKCTWLKTYVHSGKKHVAYLWLRVSNSNRLFVPFGEWRFLKVCGPKTRKSNSIFKSRTVRHRRYVYIYIYNSLKWFFKMFLRNFATRGP